MTSELQRCIREAVDLHMPDLPETRPKYKTATEAAIMTESKYGIANLLEKQVNSALKEMKADLDKQLWGETPPTNAAQYKYGTVKISVPDEILKDAYVAPMRQNIFGESPIMKYLQPKETTMSDETIAAEAVRKRKEKRAKEAVEIIGDYVEGTEWDNGDLIDWAVKFHDNPDKTYDYIALRGGNRWYITGDDHRYSGDELVEKIVTLALRGTVTSGCFDL